MHLPYLENITLSYGRLFLNGKPAGASQPPMQPATSHGVLQATASLPAIRPVASISQPLSIRVQPVKPVRDSKKPTNASTNTSDSVKSRAAARTTRKSVVATRLPTRTVKRKRPLEYDAMKFKSASTSSSTPNSGQTNSTKLKLVNN
eukprot:460816_1